MSKQVQLVVGLGNPGPQYERTRHNIGFMVVDTVVQHLRLDKPQKTATYELWMHDTDTTKTLLVKPLTFMNKSGEAVAELVRFFKVPDENVLVIHDDLDLPLGTVRLREGGGTGGHNGVASIEDSLGYEHFRRVRIGISRPPATVPADAYVLQAFTDDEQALVPKIIDEVGEIVLQLESNKRSFQDETIRIEN